jgi:hypothetical protein
MPTTRFQGAARVSDTVAGPFAAGVFGALSAVRRRRIFHPYGRAFDATVDLAGLPDLAPSVLASAGRHRAVIRLSRGAGLPEPLPDILGVAVRLLDVGDEPGQHQDLLLASSGAAPVLRHTLLPVREFGKAHFSSVLPQQVGGKTVVLGLRPVWSRELLPSARLDQVADALTSARLTFDLEVAAPGGEWRTAGRIEVGAERGEAESESLRFNPFNDAGGVEPVGALNGLRRRAYAASQAVRPTPLAEPTGADAPN